MITPKRVDDDSSATPRGYAGGVKRRWAKLDLANRGFVVLVTTALLPYVLLGAFGCGLLTVAAYRLAGDGLSGLQQNGEDLRPAVVFFAVVSAGTVAAIASVRRQLRATRALTVVVREQMAAAPSTLAETARRCGLDGRVDVVDDAGCYSFTYGVFSPRVAVSRGLVAMLDDEQLDAVLHHERYHVRNRDTLKMVVAQAASVAFFFLPALRHLRIRYLAGRELAADRQAFETTGTPALAGALFRVLEQPASPTFGAAAALGGSEFLDLRISQLETGDEPPLRRLPPWSVAVTVAGLLALTTAFLVTALTTEPMPMMNRSDAPGGAGLSFLGAVACSAGWALVVSIGLHQVLRRRRMQ